MISLCHRPLSAGERRAFDFPLLFSLTHKDDVPMSFRFSPLTSSSSHEPRARRIRNRRSIHPCPPPPTTKKEPQRQEEENRNICAKFGTPSQPPSSLPFSRRFTASSTNSFLASPNRSRVSSPSRLHNSSIAPFQLVHHGPRVRIICLGARPAAAPPRLPPLRAAGTQPPAWRPLGELDAPEVEPLPFKVPA